MYLIPLIIYFLNIWVSSNVRTLLALFFKFFSYFLHINCIPLLIYLFIWVHARSSLLCIGLSLVVASGGGFLLRCVGFSLGGFSLGGISLGGFSCGRTQTPGARASVVRACGLSSCDSPTLECRPVVAAHGLSCSVACESSWTTDQTCVPCIGVDSYPLYHQGSPQ